MAHECCCQVDKNLSPASVKRAHILNSVGRRLTNRDINISCTVFIPMLWRPRSRGPPTAIVIKLGISSILSEQKLQPRLGLLARLVDTCIALRAAGHKVVLVCSGAIGMGRRRRMSLLDGGLQGRWCKKDKSLNEKQAASALLSYYTLAPCPDNQGHLIALGDSLFSRFNQPIAQILFN
ncbi:hypothetical protein PCASD_05528 [Puccinia coronata f. sp. avenae]|nr:hypothetical protein PCASD_05528 [Puccinia coronata f. sp. avenae]